MSARRSRQNNALIDWRMLPLALLSLAIGAVVSYSVGSNFGLGYVAIDSLPNTAAELVQNREKQLLEDVVELATEPSTKPSPKSPQQPVAREQNATPPKPGTQPEAQPGTQTAQEPGQQPQVATAVNVSEADVEKTSVELNQKAGSEQASTAATADTKIDVAAEPDQPDSQEVRPEPSDSVVAVKNNIVQSVTTDEEGNEVVRLSVERLDSAAAGIDPTLPDTAEIVARANLAAGVSPEPEELELESELALAFPSVEKEQQVRFSTDPEDLPILRVIIPDAEPPKAVSTVPELEDPAVEFTEATLSREITDAVDSGVVSRVLQLIKEGQPIDGKDRSGQTMLLKAAWNGDEEMFDALLDLGANIQVTSNDGRTPLFSAVVSGNIDLVKKLVSLGAAVDTKTNEGKTPLMVSAWSNYPEIARYLLAQGAKPDLIDSNSRNALFYALWDRNIDVIRTLIQYGARLDQVDTNGHSAVDIARLRRIELPGMNLEAEQKTIN